MNGGVHHQLIVFREPTIIKCLQPSLLATNAALHRKCEISYEPLRQTYACEPVADDMQSPTHVKVGDRERRRMLWHMLAMINNL